MIEFTFVYKEAEVKATVDISYSYENELYYIETTLEPGWRDKLTPEAVNNQKKYPNGELAGKLYNIMTDLERQTMEAINEVEPDTYNNLDPDTINWNSTIIYDDTLVMTLCPNTPLEQ